MKSIFWVTMIALLSTACIDNPRCYERPIDIEVNDDGPWILADHYHSRKQNPEDYVLKEGEFGYQGVFGFRRIFQHLTNNGYHWGSTRELPLSRERLKGYDVLFINLVSSDRPDFSDDEVKAIIEFVDGGGGLFVIADHTNVYRHAERVNRFLIPMGIEVLYSIAVDFPPEHSIAGLGWTLTDDFTDHPVAKDLHQISLQTGGPMQSDGGGVALTSDKSFADFWDPEDTGGYYGNWRFDGDESVEPKGPLEVVTAVNYGKGRIVVVGDQNIFGDAWTHYVDNFELAANAFEWLAKREDAAKPLHLQRPSGTLIGLDQRHTKYFGGKQGANGEFAFYVNMNRDGEITGRGINRFNGFDDALMIINPTVAYSDEEIAQIRSYLKDGKKVILSFEPGMIEAPTQQLLKAFAPAFSVRSGTKTSNIDSLLDFAPTETKGSFVLSSKEMDVDGISLSAYHFDPTKEENMEEDIEPYLYNINSDWGASFISGKKGDKTIDIARWAKVEKGAFIIFPQDGFFRNRTMGSYLRAPRKYNKPVYLLQKNLQNYLKVKTARKPVVILETSECPVN